MTIQPGMAVAHPSVVSEADAAPMNPGRPRLRAAVCITLGVATAGLLSTGLTTGAAGAEPTAAVLRTLALVGWLVGGLVIWRQGRLLAPVLLAATGAASAASLGAARLALHPALADPQPARVLEMVGGALATAFFFHAIVAMPEGCLANPMLRRIGAAIYTTCLIAAGVLVSLSPPNARTLARVLVALVIGLVGVAAAFTLSRYHRLPAADRRTGQWIGTGAALAACLLVLLMVMFALLNWPSDPLAAAFLASLPMPLAVASDETSLSRRSDRALVRSLTWLGAIVAAGVITVAVILGSAHRPDADERPFVAATLLAGIIVLGAWEPIRRVARRRATHFTYGDRPEPDAALSLLSSRLNRSVPLGQLLDELADMLRHTLGPAGATIWTGHGRHLNVAATTVRDAGQLALDDATHRALLMGAVPDARAHAEALLPACGGASTDAIHVAAVSHQGQLLGLIAVRRPARGEPFTEGDDRILQDVAVHLGLALHNAQLDATLSSTLIELRQQAAELEASRARLVSAANTERRRLERNLHDGAQQQLVGLAVTIGITRDLVRRDPDEAARLLGAMANDLRGAIDELRNLARGIYPPLLADRGLGEAVGAAARRSPLPVSLTSSLSARYSPDVEAAVYFCCLEALQNVSKHAPDAAVSIDLSELDRQLCFEVRDDGPGFDPRTVPRGDGLVNMTDRVGALGGRVELSSTPGSGTAVRGWIPVADLA